MHNLLPYAHTDEKLFSLVPLYLVVAMWLLWWPPLVAVVRSNRELPWGPGLLWGLLGPVGLLLQPKPKLEDHQRVIRYRDFHPWGWLAGSLVVLIAAGGTTAGHIYFTGNTGESLHAPLAMALAVGGVVAGFIQSVIGRRVGFFENVGIVWVYTLGTAAAGNYLELFFTYGTTTVFLLTIILTSVLILMTALLLGSSFGFLLTGDGAWSFSFSYESWIGRRYLMARRRKSFVSVITFISVAGVTVGVWAMLVVLSVMSGFEADLKTKILGANAHLILQKAGGEFTEWKEVLEKARAHPHVTGASPFVFNEVMLSSESNLSGALIKGVDPTTVNEVSELHKSMVQGGWGGIADPKTIPDPGAPEPDEDQAAAAKKTQEIGGEKKPDEDKKPSSIIPAFGIAPPPIAEGAVLPGIVIGQELSRNLRVFLGDKITVVSPVAELGPTGPVPRARTFRVAAIFYSGMYEYDSKFVYIDLKESMSFFTMRGAVTGLELKVDDVDNTTRIGREIVQTLGGFPYRTRDWKEMNRNLFAALKLEKIAMFIILSFMLILASFLILCVLIMVVLQKGKEIAILKSMGATDASIMKIFVTYGLVIGGLGTLMGMCMGYLSCRAIEAFGIGLDPEVYYIANLPVKMNPVEFALVALAAVIISLLATVYPSLQAARLRPVEGLRYE
ncbi:MAG: FtsX-like permease family protein [Myxococcota bacterium]